ncbi:MAG: type II toxin-antitoxin system RelE/ParE family toxin [Ferruginibacter sp.]
MNYKVELTENFKKEAKKLINKYASLQSEIEELGESLSRNPVMGTALGNDVYKIRLAIASKNKGKSGGARVITFVKVLAEKVYLLSIYNKSEKESISNKEIELILKNYL